MGGGGGIKIYFSKMVLGHGCGQPPGGREPARNTRLVAPGILEASAPSWSARTLLKGWIVNGNFVSLTAFFIPAKLICTLR